MHMQPYVYAYHYNYDQQCKLCNYTNIEMYNINYCYTACVMQYPILDMD